MSLGCRAHPRSDWHSFSSPLCPAQPKWEWANIVARQTRRPSSAAVRTRRIGTALRDQSVTSAVRRAASATSGRVDSNSRAVQREGFDSVEQSDYREPASPRKQQIRRGPDMKVQQHRRYLSPF